MAMIYDYSKISKGTRCRGEGRFPEPSPSCVIQSTCNLPVLSCDNTCEVCEVSSTEGLRDERPGFLLGAAHVGAVWRAQVQIAASQRQAGVPLSVWFVQTV